LFVFLFSFSLRCASWSCKHVPARQHGCVCMGMVAWSARSHGRRVSGGSHSFLESCWFEGGREGRAAGARGHRERQVGLSPSQSTRRFSPLPLHRTAAFTSVEELDRLRQYRGAYPSDGASLRVCPLPVLPLVTWSTCFPHCRRAAEFFVSMRKERQTSLQQRARRAASARSGFLFGANSAHPLYIAWPACTRRTRSCLTVDRSARDVLRRDSP
jgi:hypothetical protein